MKPDKLGADHAQVPLPCPFCGDEASSGIYSNPLSRYVRCDNPDCVAEPEVTDTTRARAVEQWNRRARLTSSPEPQSTASGLSQEIAAMEDYIRELRECIRDLVKNSQDGVRDHDLEIKGVELSAKPFNSSGRGSLAGQAEGEMPSGATQRTREQLPEETGSAERAAEKAVQEINKQGFMKW